MKQKISITMEEALVNQVDSIIDNLYIRNRSQAIEYLVKKSLGDNKNAVILAGGPEEKLKINSHYMIEAQIGNRKLIEHTVIKLRESGFKTVYIVAKGEILTRAFSIIRDGSAYGIEVNYIEEKVSKGTAHTLKQVKGKIDTKFLVVYGDLFFKNVNINKLWESHIKFNPIATLMLTTSSKPSEKGTVIMEGNKVLKFMQKPKESDVYLVFSPIFVAEPEILEYPGDTLEQVVFPKLAEKELLRGYLSSEKEIHIHNKEDLDKIKL